MHHFRKLSVPWYINFLHPKTNCFKLLVNYKFYIYHVYLYPYSNFNSFLMVVNTFAWKMEYIKIVVKSTNWRIWSTVGEAPCPFLSFSASSHCPELRSTEQLSLRINNIFFGVRWRALGTLSNTKQSPIHNFK